MPRLPSRYEPWSPSVEQSPVPVADDPRHEIAESKFSGPGDRPAERESQPYQSPSSSPESQPVLPQTPQKDSVQAESRVHATIPSASMALAPGQLERPKLPDLASLLTGIVEPAELLSEAPTKKQERPSDVVAEQKGPSLAPTRAASVTAPTLAPPKRSIEPSIPQRTTTSVEVRIGRIEVKAAPQAPRPAIPARIAPSSRVSLSLCDYLERRRR
jgi:hypothetical protein